MNLIALYLKEFNQTYRLTPALRRQTRQTVADFLVTLAIMALLGCVLYVWEG